MAAEKNRTMTQLNDITECCICLKTFTDPRMLPCIHTFCFQCLHDLVEKSNKKPGDEIKCPVCRNEFTLPDDGVQGVQKNFFMVSFTEVRNSLRQLDEAIPCDICKAKNDSADVQISEATMRCFNCQENLCKDCYDMHKSFKAMKTHRISKLGNEVDEADIMKSLQVMNCVIHCGKPLDYYCADCKKVVCVSCFVESHKTHDCKDVNTVEKEFRQSIKSNANIISTLAEELQDKKNKMESREEFLREIATTESEILQRRKELKAMIDENTKSLLDTLDEIKKRHLKEIQVEEEELDRRLTILESFSRYCDELRSKGSASEVCRNKVELLRRADELEEDHETYIMRPHVSFDVTFEATEIDKLCKTTKGNIIGLVKEDVEQLGDICVVIGGDRNLYKVNLRRQCESVSCIQDDVSTEVHRHTAAAVYNNTVFIAGVGKGQSEIWKYNIVSGWNRCGFLIQNRKNHCAVFIGETLYICGGRRQDIVIKSIEAYNELTEKSIMVGQLKVDTEFAASVAYNGSIYVFGGRDSAANLLDCVQLYNPNESICTLLSMSLPRPCWSFRCMLWDNYAIILDHDMCFILDLNEKIWRERQQFQTGTICFGMVAENGRIFIIGGAFRDEVKYVRVSSILNNEEVKWNDHKSLPYPFTVLASANLTLKK